MPKERRFLIAPALARLIQRECSAVSRIVEGHFHPNPQRAQIVRVERDHAVLLLFVPGPDGTVAEERAEVPIAHAEALIDVAPGRVEFDRFPFGLTGGGRALIERFVAPNGLNLVRVLESEGFVVPDWFGPEVTERAEFENSALALNGAPDFAEVQLSNRALENLLDTFDRLQGHQERSTTLGRQPAAVAAPSDPTPAERETALKLAAVPRANVRALDEGIARFARSLTPRPSRPT